jgi:hypothetical protein
MAACGTGIGIEERRRLPLNGLGTREREREREKRATHVNAAEGRGTLVFSQCASTLVA